MKRKRAENREKRRKDHGKWFTFVAVLLGLTGIAVLFYPTVSNMWNTYLQSQVINSYQTSAEALVAEGKADYSEEWERAYAYNSSIQTSTVTSLPDSFDDTETVNPGDEYMDCLNLTGDGIMGYISIPKINLRIPIYHTTEDDVLQKGVGHLVGSSLPVGGESTHAVLAGHCGLPSSTLFTDLEYLEVGDHFYLYILDDILAYEVEEILVVEPDDTESLLVQEGRDLVTLVTCTPYGVNTERLLVRGCRVEYSEETAGEEAETPSVNMFVRHIRWTVAGLACLAVALPILLWMLLREKKRRRRKSADDSSKSEPEERGPDAFT
ncbi:MAG: class C sortase [Lachnospiraceae bacterium]|nr:class C sortase [Lachnospiraceae bacterium]